MNLVFALLPAAIVLGLLGLAGFIWAVRSGQFNDLDTPSRRMLFDENETHENEGDTPRRT